MASSQFSQIFKDTEQQLQKEKNSKLFIQSSGFQQRPSQTSDVIENKRKSKTKKKDHEDHDPGRKSEITSAVSGGCSVYIKYIALLVFSSTVPSLIIVLLAAKPSQFNCNDLLNDPSADTLELQTCEEAYCRFDVSLCSLPCPFGYTQDEKGCPNSCLCAANTDKFEGDIQLSEPQLEKYLEQYGILTGEKDKKDDLYKVSLWNNRMIGGRYKVPYVLDSNYSSFYVDMIKAGMKLISDNSCIDFVERTTERQYLNLVNKYNRCSSWIGKLPVGTKHTENGQIIKLREERCQPQGVIAHEILHTLGIPHEQARPDRDSYVKIMFKNIKAGAEPNFQKLDVSADHSIVLTPYDSSSIMHYSGFAFSKDRNKPTIVRIDSGLPPEVQRLYMTENDISTLNHLYKCPKTEMHTDNIDSMPKTTFSANEPHWTPWGQWEGCSSGCWLGGIGVRRRYCFSGTVADCRKSFPLEDDVHIISCAVNPCRDEQSTWSSWGPWNKCSRTCGGGKSIRFRNSTSSYYCDTRRTEVKDCNEMPCSDIPEWSTWKVMVDCSKTCGDNAFRTRRRFCVKPNGFLVRKGCEGERFSTEACNLPSCPLDDYVSLPEKDGKRKDTKLFNRNSRSFTNVCSDEGVNFYWYFGDFNGDGFTDVVCGEVYFRNGSIGRKYTVAYLSSGGSVLEKREIDLSMQCYESYEPKVVLDVNADGLDEIACRKDDDSVGVKLSKKSGETLQTDYRFSTRCSIENDYMIALDYDGDNEMELLCKQAEQFGYVLFSFPH